MELPFSQFSMFLSFLLFLVIAIKLMRESKRGKGPNLPPGPRKLPLIGNLHQLMGSLPHHTLRDMANEYGPIMHLRFGEVPTVIISSAEAAKEVMKTHDLVFADRPKILVADIIGYNSTQITFSPYGDHWRQLRKICVAELLNVKRVQSFESLRQEEVKDLIKTISLNPAGTTINLSQMIFTLTNNIIARAAFGRKLENQDEFIATLRKIVDLAGGFDLPDTFPSLKFLHPLTGAKAAMEKIHHQIDKILESVLQEHKAARKLAINREDKMHKEDLVDVLLRVQESGDLEVPITTDTIKAVILETFIAGTDTSSTALEWAMAELMKNPQVMEQAQAEVRQAFKGKSMITESEVQQLDYLRLVIKETLRLHAPVPLLVPRVARQRCELGGYEIQANTRLMVNAWAICRDPKYWENAECFEPERHRNSTLDFKGNNFEFIPFGAGRRACPGILFGISNLELPLAQLLLHFDWKLPNGIEPNNLDMTEAFGETVRKKTNLHVIGIPYGNMSDY
ncbi:desmethyl-deoxy-podophyllotoxin synthase-like isoform X1 [Solanum stenotomum]|uniref:desmethyl-deoxy-podophyllotoxin synthase-like isoform X1 n=1 Tax=Solanum stenotomum TaxID=172797 RepID=UPI0020CFEFDF|nr:desmethyl-deoxy-podophyllotoxin synthase-like isoform X1 [Solanum stenotomum]